LVPSAGTLGGAKAREGAGLVAAWAGGAILILILFALGLAILTLPGPSRLAAATTALYLLAILPVPWPSPPSAPSPWAHSIASSIGITTAQAQELPGDLVFYHADHLDSPRAVSDRYGNLLELIRYDVLGKVRGVYERDAAGNIVEKTSGMSTNLTFTGQEPDEETSLIYFGKRFYDPEVGYFITIDPALKFASPYNYGGYDPLNSIDPDGAEPFSFATALIVASLFAGATIIDTLVKGGDLGTALKAGAFAFGASLFASMSAHVLSVAFEGVSAVQTLQFAYAGFGLYQTFKEGNIATGVLSLYLAVFGPPGDEDTRARGEQARPGVAETGQAPGSGRIESLERTAKPAPVGVLGAVGRSIAKGIDILRRDLLAALVGFGGGNVFGAIKGVGLTVTGLVTANPSLIGKGVRVSASAAVPRFDCCAGPGFSMGIDPITQIGVAAQNHDRFYAKAKGLVLGFFGRNATSADLTLVRNSFRDPFLGPIGQTYRLGLGAVFLTKVGVQESFGVANDFLR